MPRIITLYLLGLLQGITFTLIPGASIFLTSKEGFDLNQTQYGQLFIPMIIMAILFSFFGGGVAKFWGIRRVSIASCMINFLCMAVFALSARFISDGFWILLVSLFLLGAGFGANLATLNSYVLEFFPKHASSALTALHATLGIGTAIGPIFFQFAEHFLYWWMAPSILALGYLILISLCLRFFPLYLELPKSMNWKIKKGVWIFFAVAILYGICETAFGNWGILYLKTIRDVPAEMASISLSFFWAAVTFGRMIASISAIWISPKKIYGSIGIVLIASLLILDFSHYATLAFLIAGLGCSAFLPLTVSLAQKEDLPHAEMISGLVIGIYMLGYGISAYGGGFLDLKDLFVWLFVPTALISVLGIYPNFRNRYL